MTQADGGTLPPQKPDGSADTAGMGNDRRRSDWGPTALRSARASASLLAGFSDWQRRRTQAAAVSMVNGIDAAAASVPGFQAGARIGCRSCVLRHRTLAQKIVTRTASPPLPKAS